MFTQTAKDNWNEKLDQFRQSREFWKERRFEEQTEITKNERLCEMDLMKACPSCHVIRSVWESVKEECDSCGYSVNGIQLKGGV